MKPTIAFVTGGYSGESVISYKSAVTIENNLDLTRYSVYRIDITPEGWFHRQKGGTKIDVDRNDFSLTIGGKKILFDGVLIGIHGTPGEDGKLQGYFDLLHLPYTSCDAAVSALTFNKRFAVAVAAFNGIHVARSVPFGQGPEGEPGRVGPSPAVPGICQTKQRGFQHRDVKGQQAFRRAGRCCRKSLREDDQVLVEEFIARQRIYHRRIPLKGGDHHSSLHRSKEQKRVLRF